MTVLYNNKSDSLIIETASSRCCKSGKLALVSVPAIGSSDKRSRIYLGGLIAESWFLAGGTGGCFQAIPRYLIRILNKYRFTPPWPLDTISKTYTPYEFDQQ